MCTRAMWLESRRPNGSARLTTPGMAVLGLSSYSYLLLCVFMCRTDAFSSRSRPRAAPLTPRPRGTLHAKARRKWLIDRFAFNSCCNGKRKYRWRDSVELNTHDLPCSQDPARCQSFSFIRRRPRLILCPPCDFLGISPGRDLDILGGPVRYETDGSI
jgi:hypothetical protein